MDEKRVAVLLQAEKIFGLEEIEKNKTAVISKLKSTYDIDHIEYTEAMVKKLLNDVIFNKQTENLFTKYIMPPFSILDTKQGEWQKRKANLDEFIGSSLEGRKEGLAYGTLQVREDDNGTSQFDSVLCELILKWFVPNIKTCPNCKHTIKK